MSELEESIAEAERNLVFLRFARATELATDSFIALQRVLTACLRDAEERLTTEQRLRYYELRDQGMAAFDAIEEAENYGS